MKWKVPANQIKGHRKLTRHKQETRQRQQRPQNVVSSSAPVAPTVTNPFEEFGLGWDHERLSLYEDPSTVKYIHDDDGELLLNDADVDLRTTVFTDSQGNNVNFPDVYYQSPLNSCTGNALAFCYEFDMLKQKISFGPNKSSTPSRLFIYYYERVKENRIGLDKGALMSDGIEVLLEKGVCSETDWPYDATKYSEEPSTEAINNANAHKTIKETSKDSFIALHNTSNNIKNTLKLGFPVVFGFKVYSSFFTIHNPPSNYNNIYTMPIPAESETIVGGHAAVFVGFKEQEKVFIVRNSWGSTWGDNGYFYMPYDIIDSTKNVVVGDKIKTVGVYVSDIWSIMEVS
jgi:C1A family cysteine protease